MTKRERTLLLVLLAILLTFGLYFWVNKGNLQEFKANRQVYQALQDQEEAYLEVKDQITNKEQQLQELQEKINSQTARILDLTKSYDAHYTFTDLAASNNLKVTALAITPPVPVPDLLGKEASPGVQAPIATGLDAQPKADTDADAKAKEATDAKAKEAADAKAKEAAKPIVALVPHQVHISLNLTGTLANALKMADDVGAKADNLIVSGFTIQEFTPTGSTEIQMEVTVYLLINTMTEPTP